MVQSGFTVPGLLQKGSPAAERTETYRGEGAFVDTFGAGRIHILVAESCRGAAARLPRLLPALQIQAEVVYAARSEIAGLLRERPVEALILGPEDFDLAAEISGRTYTGVLILASGEALGSMARACIGAGILTASPENMEAALRQLLAVCARLRTLRLRDNTLRRQLDDTRLVNRAKLLLIDHLKMSEGDAHRYIEKTAMDTGVKRREVAESIIRTYEG